MSLTFHLSHSRQEMVKHYLPPVQQCYIYAYFCTENYTQLSPIAGVVLKPPIGPNTLEITYQFHPLTFHFCNNSTTLPSHTRLRLPRFPSSSCFMIKML